jgi:hypothetical protein
MNLFALIPWWGRALMLAALASALIGFGFLKGDEHRGAKDEAEMNAHLLQDKQQAIARHQQVIKDQQAAAAQYEAEAQANAKENFRRIQRQADVDRTKDAQILASNRRADALASELRNRPARPARPASDAKADTASAGSADSAHPTACTGAGLYRDDADFLGWFAAQTARLVIERDSYYAKYQSLIQGKP